MISIFITFIISFLATIIIIRTQFLHNEISGDKDLSGPQKFHTQTVPRIGGVAICISIFTATTLDYKDNTGGVDKLLLFFCTLPAFCIGLAEDLTKKISIRLRLIITASGALLAIYFLNIHINKIDIYGLDFLLTNSIISLLFTAFAITGLANAYNMIDGFHGLSSMVGIITLIALGYIGISHNDPLITFLSFSLASAIFGFFLINYPLGLIFLGDGGAYLIGFWIAVISIMTINRHQDISPWFALMINSYPIIETLFTIYRRKFHQNKSPGHPDGIHFHTLIFRRILIRKEDGKNLIKNNAKTAPYLWTLTIIGITPALIWYKTTYILMLNCFLFACFYIWLYSRIIKFKTPNWLKIS